MRVVAAMVVLLALYAGCSKASKNKEPRVQTKDGASVESKDGASVKTKDRPSVGPLTDEQIQQLFHATVSCQNRASCQARDDLHELGKTSAPRVAVAALEIMADPLSKTDQGVGQMSMIFVDDWLRSGPDEAARRRTAQALKRVVAQGSTFMRTTAYALLAEYRLPDAKQFLMSEVEKPARDESARGAAAAALGVALDGDFSLVLRWLRDDQPHHWHAALAMMDSFDDFNDGNEPLWAEVRVLLIALGKRPELPGVVIYDLARYYGFYLEDDPSNTEVRALAERWAKHPDDLAAGQMRKILL